MKNDHNDMTYFNITSVKNASNNTITCGYSISETEFRGKDIQTILCHRGNITGYLYTY